MVDNMVDSGHAAAMRVENRAPGVPYLKVSLGLRWVNGLPPFFGARHIRR